MIRTFTSNMRVDVKENLEIHIETDNLPVELKKTEEEAVTVDVDIRFSSREEGDITIEEIVKHSYDSEANRMDIEIENPFERGLRKARIVIAIPDQSTVFAELDNGPFAITDLTGEFNIEGENGPIDMRDCAGKITIRHENGPARLSRCDGELRIEMENGPFAGMELSGELTFEGDNGPVKVQRCSCTKASVVTENGPIYYEFDPIENGEFDFKSENSKIHLMLPENLSYELNGENEHGSFYVGVEGEYTINDTDEGTKTLHIVRGDGKVKIQASNENGSIVLVDDVNSSGHHHRGRHHHGHHFQFDGECLKDLGRQIGKFFHGPNKDRFKAKVAVIREKGEQIKEKAQKLKEMHHIAEDQEFDDTISVEIESLGEEIGAAVEEIGQEIGIALENAFTKPRRPHPPRHTVRVKRERTSGQEETSFRDDETLKQSRMKILQMIEDGKITVEEAEKLLKALD